MQQQISTKHIDFPLRIFVFALLINFSSSGATIVPVNGVYASAATGQELISVFRTISPQYPTSLGFALTLLDLSQPRFSGMKPMGLISFTDYYPWSEAVVSSIGYINEFRIVEVGTGTMTKPLALPLSVPEPASVPEPSTFLMIGAALSLYGGYGLRRRSKQHIASGQIV